MLFIHHQKGNKIQIVNIQGQVVYSQNILTNETLVNIPSLSFPIGMYILEVIGNQLIYKTTFVKQ